MPFADVGPSPIPDWMDDEDGVLLTDAVATGYFGAQLGDIAEGDVVVVPLDPVIVAGPWISASILAYRTARRLRRSLRVSRRAEAG
ncbi:hypothetical protein AB0F43_21865 [Kribbella sp. NPDC023972]|uniref:hypothetical protein n=1 Tax=Kribbella sp. NPDC023972 TaxID=3154795 RepID=UPI0033DA0E3E